jgi:hypothetical protein
MNSRVAFTRAVEQKRKPVADFEAIMEQERRMSPTAGGRTVFDDFSAGPALRNTKRREQLSFGFAAGSQSKTDR